LTGPIRLDRQTFDCEAIGPRLRGALAELAKQSAWLLQQA